MNTTAAVPETPSGIPLPPPLPSTSDLAHIKTLSSIAELRSVLLQAFPTSFGGLYSADGSNSNFVIAVVKSKDRSAIQSYVETYLRANSPNDRGPYPVTYTSAKHSLSSLDALRDRIIANRSALAARGKPIIAAGIDDRDNQVAVTPTSGHGAQSTYEATLHSLYGPGQIEVGSPAVLGKTDRFSDSGAWHGGDQIVSNQGFGCTTAFGAHDVSTGSHAYMLTAGHCTEGGAGSNFKWYNTPFSNPQLNNTTAMGFVSSAAAYANGFDGERITTSRGSSNMFWKQSAQPEVVANDGTMIAGEMVCEEGSVSSQACGVVAEVDQTVALTNGDVFRNEAFVPGANPISGDSGGPVVEPTGFGYIAVGLVTGTAFNNQGVAAAGIFEDIQPVQSTLGVKVNSLVHP